MVNNLALVPNGTVVATTFVVPGLVIADPVENVCNDAGHSTIHVDTHAVTTCVYALVAVLGMLVPRINKPVDVVDGVTMLDVLEVFVEAHIFSIVVYQITM